MLIHRTSPFTGEERSLEINVTETELSEWKQGTPIEEAMPNLTDDERHFIMAGIFAEEVAIWAINLLSGEKNNVQ